MKIKNEQKAIQELVKELKETIEGKAYTESTIELIQDKVEHALVTYTKEDIQNEAFLNVCVEEARDEHVNILLFIQEDIHITIQVGITQDFNGSTIKEIESILVH